MKIDNSISSYYFSQRRQQAGTIAPIEESGGDARPRQAPTIAPPSTSNALSNALWMTAARDGENTASISAKEGPAASDGSVSDEFLKEAKKSLVEKIREQVLKAMGLTEADLKEMPPSSGRPPRKRSARLSSARWVSSSSATWRPPISPTAATTSPERAVCADRLVSVGQSMISSDPPKRTEIHAPDPLATFAGRKRPTPQPPFGGFWHGFFGRLNVLTRT
ncbi:hypothetical protein ACU4I5_06485 [Ensifer adhaerens]